MLAQRTIETSVGLFLLAGILSLVILAFKISGLTTYFNHEGYHISAQFDDIGQLKVRGPVKVGGVTIGEVTNIHLDSDTYRAVVTMRIDPKIVDIPSDSTASILTSGLLGDNYISLTPMYSNEFLKNGSIIAETHSAMILEKMIGQFLFNAGQSSKGNNQTGAS